jgi:hypothetical protein
LNVSEFPVSERKMGWEKIAFCCKITDHSV